MFCQGCRKQLSRQCFRRAKMKQRDILYNICKECMAFSKSCTPEKAWAIRAHHRAWIRAVSLRRDFTISWQDVMEALPSDGLCPVLQKPLDFRLKKRLGEFSPSLDRVHSDRGYIPGNLLIVSNRVNRTKAGLSHSELFLLGQFYARPLHRHSLKWDQRFLTLSREISLWSRDPSTKVGAVLIRPDRTIASMGFNGFPRGMPDDPARYSDRSEKYSRVVHAEMNALMFCQDPVPLTGFTLYTWPVISCDRCAVHMIQAGLRRFVGPRPTADFLSRWQEQYDRTKSYFAEVNAEVLELEP